MALALTLRRGILLHHERQRRDPPAQWRSFHHPMIRRLGVQNFGIIGLGRINTAVALRAKAFNCRVMFYDPYLPNGAELALGIERAASLEELLRQTDTLSIHTPLTPETRGLLGHVQLGLLRPGAVVVNDARGPILDLDALLAHLKGGHIAAAGLDVLPNEPPAASSSRSAVTVLSRTGIGFMCPMRAKSTLPAHSAAPGRTQRPCWTARLRRPLLQAQDIGHDVPQIIVADDDVRHVAMGRAQHRGQGDRRHPRRLRNGLEGRSLAVRRRALPFFDGVTFRTYLLHVLTALCRVTGDLGVRCARGGHKHEERHCGKNGFHR